MSEEFQSDIGKFVVMEDQKDSYLPRRHGGKKTRSKMINALEDFVEPDTELTIDDVVLKSKWANVPVDQLSDKILEVFNAGISPAHSCFVLNPAPGRALHRVPISNFLIGHRNQVTELADPSGQRIGLVFNADPMIEIKVIGTVSKTAQFFGKYGKYVLNVPAGYFAKGSSKNNPVLYGEGTHVIIDPTFVFNENDGFVNQNEPYIQHSTIHILRIPSGKLAKVLIGTEARIIESQRDPYIFVDAQFKLIRRDDDDSKNDKGSFFYSATDRYIEHGSIKRIIPHTGEVAITYDNGILHIIWPPKDGKPIVIDSPTHNFEAFISVSLQTCLFPSEDTKKQMIKDNPKASADEHNLKILQTRDSLRVGVVLVVAFKIKDPELAITKLGRDGILPHIENIAFADMGKAVQLNTLQEVLYSTQNNPQGSGDHSTHTIQDLVRKNLAKDLEDYGIELARLNIETLKVLDEDIAKKLAGQSVTSAEYTTKQASLVKEYEIKTTEARMRAETDNIAVQQVNQAIISQAQAKLDSAKREADALLITADAKRKAEEMKGELYTKFPLLFELEMAKIKSQALASATIYMTPQEAGNFFNSPIALLNTLNQTDNK